MISPVDGTSARRLGGGLPAATTWPSAGGEVRLGARPGARVHPRSGTRVQPRLSRPLALAGAVAWILVVLLALALVSRYAAIARVGYRLAAMQSEAERLDQENAMLRVRTAELESPVRIDTYARTRLGMVRPENFALASVAPPIQVAQAASEQAKAVSSKHPSRGFWASLGRFIFQAVAGTRAAEAHQER